jgi:hypothetical protein
MQSLGCRRSNLVSHAASHHLIGHHFMEVKEGEKRKSGEFSHKKFAVFAASSII